ncbi:MAG: tetratricopeptide repeat protein [Puniceicoccaceae bacterium]
MKESFQAFVSLLTATALFSSASAMRMEDQGGYALEKGLQYFHGEGVPYDYEAAAKHFREAAELGNVEAHLNLGFLYDLGIGVEQDYRKAANYYRLAADAGDATAQFNLGILYRFGRGVEADPAIAAVWYEKAAEQGYVDAQYNLGVLYETGQGVDANLLIADMWYILAAASDHGKAMERHEALVVQMTPEQMQQAWESAYELGVAMVAHADETE